MSPFLCLIANLACLNHNYRMKTILEVAKQAARKGGDVIAEGALNLSALKIEQKSLHDYVSEIDRNSENAIKSHILNAFPEHQVLGEEYGFDGINSNVQWIVDPLDGTTNFLRAIPHYAVSIGVLINGVLEHSVVFDVAKDELFSASRGQGAFLNDEQIKVSGLASIRGGLYATGVPFSGDNLAKIDCFSAAMIGVLHTQTSGIRRLGSAALDLAYVAAGRYDGYWEANLQVWDIAGGALLVTEAGGIVSGLQGDDQYLKTGHILASTAAAHSELLSITSEAYPF